MKKFSAITSNNSGEIYEKYAGNDVLRNELYRLIDENIKSTGTITGKEKLVSLFEGVIEYYKTKETINTLEGVRNKFMRRVDFKWLNETIDVMSKLY